MRSFVQSEITSITVAAPATHLKDQNYTNQLFLLANFLYSVII